MRAAKDEYLDIIKVIIQVQIMIIATRGKRYKLNPRKQATPFPPLNLSHTGNKCPKITIEATKYSDEKFIEDAMLSAIGSGENPIFFAIKMTITTFPLSANRVSAAMNLFPVRNTFVVPILPEPILRISP